MKYFGPSRRDQIIYRRKKYLRQRNLKDDHAPSINNQQPQLRYDHFVRGLPCHRVICDFLDRTTYWLLGRTYPCTVCRFVPKYCMYYFTLTRGVYKNLVPPRGTNFFAKLEDHVIKIGPSRRDQIESTARERAWAGRPGTC